MKNFLFLCSAGYRGREAFFSRIRAEDKEAGLKQAYTELIDVVGGEDADFQDEDPEEAFNSVRNAFLIEIAEDTPINLADPTLYAMYSAHYNSVHAERDAASKAYERQYDERELKRLQEKLGKKDG